MFKCKLLHLELFAVKLNFLLQIEVLHCVESVIVGLGLRYAMTIDQGALVVAGILGARLAYLNFGKYDF